MIVHDSPQPVLPDRADLVALAKAGDRFAGDALTAPPARRTGLQEAAVRTAGIFKWSMPTESGVVESQVSGVVVDGGVIEVEGRLVEQTPFGIGEVGRFTRRLRHDGGVWSMTAANLALHLTARGRGIGTGFVRHGEQVLTRLGFAHVDLWAGSTMGGYVWARVGYGWRPGMPPRVSMSRDGNGVWPRLAAYRARHGDPDGVLGGMLDALGVRRPGADYPSPEQVALLGWTPAATTWAGRQVMLGAHWAGRKVLAIR